ELQAAVAGIEALHVGEPVRTRFGTLRAEDEVGRGGAFVRRHDERLAALQNGDGNEAGRDRQRAARVEPRSREEFLATAPGEGELRPSPRILEHAAQHLT